MVRALRLAHVGVHVRDEEVKALVIVEIEDLDAHGAPGGLGKHLAAAIDEAFALVVFVVGVMALHVEDIEIKPATKNPCDQQSQGFLSFSVG